MTINRRKQLKGAPYPGPYTVDLELTSDNDRVISDIEGDVVATVLPFDDEIDPDFTRDATARLLAASWEMREHGHHLAMLALQSDRYVVDMEYRDVVDNWLALLARIDGCIGASEVCPTCNGAGYKTAV